MFSPRYEISTKILNSLIELEKTALVVDLAPLQTEWEVKLKVECLIKRAFSVVRYLGCSLDIDDVGKIIKDDPGRDDKPAQVALRSGVVAKEKDVQRVINWLNANRLVSQTVYLTNKFKQQTLGQKDLMTLNSLLEERILKSSVSGEYREKKSLEFSEINSPPPIEIKYQMEDLFLWFKGAHKNDIHPVIKAGVMFFELLRISPFEEDNMTSSLFFLGLVMAGEGYPMKELWPYEENLLKNKPKLLEVFSTTIESGDLTVWLEYVVLMLAGAADSTKTKIMNLVGDGPIFKSDGGKTISLSERQITIMEEMTIQNEMTIKEIRGILPMVSDDTILRDLKDLIAKKLIRKKGKTKGAVYVLGKVKGFK